MIWRKPTDELSPGEARTRQRQRRHLIYIGCAGVVGGLIGLTTGLADGGTGNLFAGDWESLALPPAVAILLAALLAFGFVLLPLSGFRLIDDYKREQNLIAFTGGCVAVLAGFPIWAVLHAGGLVAAPHPFGIWMIGFFSMFLSYLYAWWRL